MISRATDRHPRATARKRQQRLLMLVFLCGFTLILQFHQGISRRGARAPDQFGRLVSCDSDAARIAIEKQARAEDIDLLDWDLLPKALKDSTPSDQNCVALVTASRLGTIPIQIRMWQDSNAPLEISVKKLDALSFSDLVFVDRMKPAD